MKLTKKQSLENTFEKWEWLALTGKRKEDWPEREKYGKILFDCFLCEYDINQDPKFVCLTCPIAKKFGHCYHTYFPDWANAQTPKTLRNSSLFFISYSYDASCAICRHWGHGVFLF